MDQVVFDIEADGLEATKIHCVSSSTSPTIFNKQDMVEMFSQKKIYIGHNIIRYDIPTLQRLLGIKIKGVFVDTLALSWYLEPNRLNHGLAEWGEFFGIPKPKIDDWDNLTPEEYAYRCEEDVKINKKLWDRQFRQLVRLYDGEEGAWRLIHYLSFKMDCAATQEKLGWKLDVDRCEKGFEELSREMEDKTEQLKLCMPEVPKVVKRKKPAKPFKQCGNLSTSGERWFKLLEDNKLPKDFSGDVEEVVGYNPPNPGSNKQVKDWLFSLGWIPKTFKYVRDKDTNEFRKIPQINDKDVGGGVCHSIKKLYQKEPNLELLDGMSILSHRISYLKGLIENVDDKGFVKAQIQGITNTMRFKHKLVVNPPGVDKPYGELIRSCLIAPDGFELIGSDQKSLEDRTKQHYMWEYDPEYVKTMMSEDFDPHLDLGVLAEMFTEEQADEYRGGNKGPLESARHDAKQVNYSCTYGITPQGLVRGTGMSLDKANRLHKTYWKRNWAIPKISESCEVKVFNKTNWLYNPVSKFWYSLRSDRDRFSTLNQGTGAYCFDVWVGFIRKKTKNIIAQFHDEVVICEKIGKREEIEGALSWAMDKANEVLKLNRSLDYSVDFGSNYSEIH